MIRKNAKISAPPFSRTRRVLTFDDGLLSSLGASAVIHPHPDHFPFDRKGFFCRFLGRQGGIGYIAHQPCHIVVDLLFSPYLAFENRNIGRVGMMHGAGPFPDEVENALEPVGI